MRNLLRRLLASSGHAPSLLEQLDSRAMLAADLAVVMVDNAPTFVVPGDKLVLAATVSNQGDEAMAGPVTVNFLAPSVNADDPVAVVASVTKNLKLRPGQAAVLTARWTANDAPMPGVYDYGAALTPSASTGATENDTSMVAGGFDFKFLFGNYADRRNVMFSTTDDDGTIITFAIKGAGYGEFRPAEFVDDRAAIDLIGTTNASAFTMTLKGGDRLANLDNDISITGSLKAFAARGVNFTGSITAGGTIQDFLAGDLTDLDLDIVGAGAPMKFKAGAITNLRFSTATPIAAMDFNNWQWLTDESNTELEPNELSTLNAPWIGKLITRGEFSAITSISGAGAPALSVASMRIAGTFGGQMAVVGNVGTFAAASIDSGMLVCSGSIAVVTTTLAIDASFWARSIARLDSGSMERVDVATGCTFDATALPALADGNGAVITWGAGTLGALNVKGAVVQARFASGCDPVNGIVLDEDDVNAGTGVIGRILIGGAATDVIFAGTTLPALARIGGATIITANDARFLTLEPGGLT